MGLINADELDNVVTRLNNQGWQITRNDYKLIDRVLFEFPSVDAVPVKCGEWISTGFMAIKCSICGAIQYELEDTNYCPNCGAKMDGKEND